MHDLILENGTVFDGTGTDGKLFDIAVTNGRISAIGKNLGPSKDTVDATGHIITPGFIDLHTHYVAKSAGTTHCNPASITASQRP